MNRKGDGGWIRWPLRFHSAPGINGAWFSQTIDCWRPWTCTGTITKVAKTPSPETSHSSLGKQEVHFLAPSWQIFILLMVWVLAWQRSQASSDHSALCAWFPGFLNPSRTMGYSQAQGRKRPSPVSTFKEQNQLYSFLKEKDHWKRWKGMVALLLSLPSAKLAECLSLF